MSGLLSDSEIAGLAADLNSVFQTFSYNRNVVVWKESIASQLPPSSAANGAFGFGGADLQSQETYIPVSGVFPAIVRYASIKHVGAVDALQDTNMMVPIGEVRIKVTPDCYAYIESGKTEKISFDNRDWYFAGKPQASPFMGVLYYTYQLKPKT